MKKEQLHGWSRDLVERCYAAFIETWRQLVHRTPRGAVEDAGGVVRITTAIGLPNFNSVFVTQMLADLAEALRRSQAFYAHYGMPWQVHAIENVAADLNRSAGTLGLAQLDPIPRMAFAPLDGSRSNLPGLTIRHVSTPGVPTYGRMGYSPIFDLYIWMAEPSS